MPETLPAQRLHRSRLSCSCSHASLLRFPRSERAGASFQSGRCSPLIMISLCREDPPGKKQQRTPPTLFLNASYGSWEVPVFLLLFSPEDTDPQWHPPCLLSSVVLKVLPTTPGHWFSTVLSDSCPRPFFNSSTSRSPRWSTSIGGK